ncbi:MULTISPECIES: rhamnan synthesis F family protein [unclassified Microbacterium]|uniref:rhamnan synthesis F family protein n=1 Tax=unclassified Microbacterium TaxID=2609290 RepID=UPI00049328A2|nr:MULTISPECIES: rhamnan synthesis F family protein [unclassified Microbacterium]MCV0333160.1 rhamnan synthesis F family protein [Microbacterium sp.]MCV0375605.1 rhamnan synthesis F family protein [Microbacterium sp.]MCV0389040.1 rhamnan synthesis F family protein [Microbacterium sp.]MCV0417568.1 rhamnan synthesis F family protein [Microbacterium sp.]MCV0420879.1 rhamnan synthesis F family protein [Microbacterium sp.]
MRTAELTTFPTRDAARFPDGGRRLLIYVVYDRRGEVEDYVPYALKDLRRFCDTILVISNGALAPAGRATLETVADEVIERDNSGFDIWGYKHGLDHVGEAISDFDEVILANDTWFGPVRPFDPVFERMDRQELHFWGMTDHVRVEPNPFTHRDYLAYHLQSYWLVARKELVASVEWIDYWANLPAMNAYEDAVVKHEAIFTERFTSYGFIGEVAFPSITDKVENHAVLYAEQLLDAGCPTLKRRPFFQWPPYLDRLAVIGKWTLDAAARYGYPMEILMQDLARNVEPRTLNADAALLDVIPEHDTNYDKNSPLRTLAIAHIYYPELAPTMLDGLDRLPGDYDLIVTTADEGRAEQIRATLATRTPRGAVDVRVVESNDGRDQSAFLITCREELLNGGYELVVKIHSKKTPQDAFNPGRLFARQQFGNLLPSSGYVANVVALFQREPGLGLAYPPMVHIGYGTMGHAWWDNRARFVEVASDLGIRVPTDQLSPLAPFGSMYFARPQALRLLLEPEWSFEDFGGTEEYKDGGHAHVLERMPSYAAGELGYHTRTIATPTYLARSYTALEYNLDQMSSTLMDTTMQQIERMRAAGDFGDGRLEDFAYMYARMNKPELEPRFRAAFARVAPWRRRLGRLRPSRIVRRLLPKPGSKGA